MISVAAAAGPTLTDYLQGWGTLAAVGISLVLLGLEIQQRRRTKGQELRSQARRVNVVQPKFLITGGPNSLRWYPGVEVRNDSDETITAVRILMLLDGRCAALRTGFG